MVHWDYNTQIHTWQVLIFFDGAGQTQQLDQPAAVHLQLVDVATGKNLRQINHENHREIHTGVQILIPCKHLSRCVLYRRNCH